MLEALKQAWKAFNEKEVPVGAVLVHQGRVIARGYNQMELLRDATAHAEMVAIRDAVKKMGHWRHLREATLYVTLEPCPMCAGAIVQTRIKTLVYGTKDSKAGAVHSLMNLVDDSRLNHRAEIISGVLEDECIKLMKDFFAQLRGREK